MGEGRGLASRMSKGNNSATRMGWANIHHKVKKNIVISSTNTKKNVIVCSQIISATCQAAEGFFGSHVSFWLGDVHGVMSTHSREK